MSGMGHSDENNLDTFGMKPKYNSGKKINFKTMMQGK